MARTVYYSKKYTQQHTAKMRAVEPAVAAATPQKGLGKLVPLVMLGCLAIALVIVLLVPAFVAGASSAPATSAARAAEQALAANMVEYETMDAAVAAAGSTATLPQNLPEGCTVSSFRVGDNGMLEFVISQGRDSIIFRAAPGAEDLSGVDYEASGYTVNEEVGGITRGYSGVSDKRLAAAVWGDGDYSYALVADGGMEAAQMKALAESIA